MKRILCVILAALTVLILGIVGAKLLLFPSGDKVPDSVADPTNIPITAGQPSAGTGVQTTQQPQIPAVTPIIPGADESVKLLDIGVVAFHYDSTALVFDEIPSSEENGAPMVSFMPADATDTLPRVDAMPIKVSSTGEGEDNFYNMTEESWQNLAAACVLQYLSPMSQEKAQFSFSGTVVKKEDGLTMKMFTNISVTVPEDIAAQTGDVNMGGSIRLISNGENAVVTMAMYKQGQPLPSALKDAYMSMEVRP